MIGVTLVIVTSIGLLIRTSGTERCARPHLGEAPAEPGSEGMRVAGDGEIAPGPLEEAE